MIGLPKSTEFNKRVPKQKFYDNLTVSADLKRFFVEKVKAIYWRNKIAETTINISTGENVNEIQVFEIKLNGRSIDDKFLCQIDKEIPYHILFLLECEGKYQACIGFKEAVNSGRNAFKVDKYYRTEWMDEYELPLKLDGLNTDTIYENFVKQIAGDRLNVNNDEDLKTSVERNKQIEKLEKQISALQKKIKKEKQFNKQMEMNIELKKLIKDLEVLM